MIYARSRQHTHHDEIRRYLARVVVICTALIAAPLFAQSSPDFRTRVEPLLRKYCVGCHGPEEANAELRLDSWELLMEGGENGKVVVAGRPEKSPLIAALGPDAESHMPPEDEPQPKSNEIAVLRAWVKAGAKSPGPARPKELTVPAIPSASAQPPVVSMTLDPREEFLAVGRVGTIELLDVRSARKLARWDTGSPYKINVLAVTPRTSILIAAGGIPGLQGRLFLWNTLTRRSLGTLTAHDDAIDALAVSPDGTLWATGGHDRVIQLWDASRREVAATLRGHNGGIHSLAFRRQGDLLASASADETIKLWDTKTLKRVATLGQPQGAQYCVAFSHSGNWIAAGGADNRLRIWRVGNSGTTANQLAFTRYAHERAIVQIAFSPDDRYLATAGEDLTVKIWETARFTEVGLLANHSDVPVSIAWAPDRKHLIVGRLDGSQEFLPLPPLDSQPESPTTSNAPTVPATSQHQPDDAKRTVEHEPNDELAKANDLSLPSIAQGKLHHPGQSQDADWYRFTAGKGETWIFETRAARDGSPADTRLEIYDHDGNPVPRVRLQAIRDSHITFRGIDSRSIDIRLQHWEEMDLNQYVYLNGEVVRLFLYPRGPDSGFQLDHHKGRRITFFETTAVAHPLHEPCFVVQPVPPGLTPIPNGLPTFAINFENDDDREGRWKGDSLLTFTAPSAGRYFVRVTDVRGLQGPTFKYELHARRPAPTFQAAITMAKKTVNAGSGKEFEVVIDRIDGFARPVKIDIKGFPADWYVTTPLTIEPDRYIARGVIAALAQAKPLTAEQLKAIHITATATSNGKSIVQDVAGLNEIQLGPAPKLLVALARPDDPQPFHVTGKSTQFPQPDELVIHPGETITAKLVVQRNGYHGRVQFESLKLNLPHGVYVDNIGLNGVLIPEGENERTVFLTAASWVAPSSRLVHFKAQQEGSQASFPIRLRVDESGR